MLLAIAICGLCHHTNGFKDWNFKDVNKPTIEEPPQQQDKDPEVIYKVVNSTTIVSEKYGTFELPANGMLLNTMVQNVIFADNTNFNYIIDENKKLFKALEIDLNENVQFGMLRTENCHHSADFFGGNEISVGSQTIYNFENNTLNFQDKSVNFDIDTFGAILPVFYNENDMYTFLSNFYCVQAVMNVNELTYSMPLVLISDKGCPLTEIIYNEIMADSTTKVTYLDSNGVKIPRT